MRPKVQRIPMRSESMIFMSFVRKPLVIAALGAASFAVPVGALYLAGASHAAASSATQAAVVQPAPAAVASGPASALPDFSGMVQKYGPAVVNITVTTKVSTAFQGDEGDEGDEGDGDGNGNGNGGGEQQDPFGPN